MDLAVGILFLGIALALITLTLLAILRTAFARLNGPVGILRDGFPSGKTTPPFSLPDLEGHLRVAPAGDHWQLLYFANLSLVAFPELVAGINRLAQTVQELEVVILSHEDRQHCEALSQGLHLQVPVVPVEPQVYERFRVRVVPFAFLLDPDGIIRWVGVINSAEQLFHVWRIGQAAVQQSRLSVKV